MVLVGSRLGAAAGVALGAAMAATLALGAGLEGHEAFIAVSGACYSAVLGTLGWVGGRHYGRIRSRAERDCLTNAFNRSFMESCFDRLSEQARRARKKMSVTIVDVNDFKDINDTYGHRMGDEVLVQLAGALRACSTRGEIVGRWGGDEFLLLSPYVDRDAGAALHRHIRDSMEALSRKENKRISVAVGTAVFPDEGLSIDQLLHAADRHMYEDKNVRKQDEGSRRMNA